MKIGHDHTPTGVISGFQIASHRLSFDVDLTLPDSTLRHYIYYSKFVGGKIYPYGGITLKQFLDQCADKKLVPIINLNFGRSIWDLNKRPDLWKAKYTYAGWQRLARLTAEIICNNYNFSEQYLAVFNEPCKWLDRHEIGMFVRATSQGIESMRAKLPIIAGNEEFDLAIAKGDMYNYIGIHFNQDFDSFGVHPLSSVVGGGMWKIKSWKDTADNFGKPIIATEAGSWDTRYTSEAGHAKNKQIVTECKKYGYKACNIVLVDCNDSYPNLGYRRWNKGYSQIIAVPKMANGVTYFDDFLNFIREETIMEYLRPIAQQAFYEAIGWGSLPYHNNTPSLPIVTRKNENANITWADFDAVFETLVKGLIEALKKNEVFDSNFPGPMNIKYRADGSWNNNWQDVANSNPKEGA